MERSTQPLNINSFSLQCNKLRAILKYMAHRILHVEKSQLLARLFLDIKSNVALHL